MKDTTVKRLVKTLEIERVRYTNLVRAYAESLDVNEQLKDTIALLMQQKETR